MANRSIFIFVFFLFFSSYAFSASYVSSTVYSCTYRNDLPVCSPNVSQPPNTVLAVNQSGIYFSASPGSAYLAVIKGFCLNTYQTEVFVSGELIINSNGSTSLNSITCNYEPAPVCPPGSAGNLTWPSSGNLSCVGQCEVVQVSDSVCTGTPAEGGMCSADFDRTGNACPDAGEGGGSASSASSASSGSGGGGSSSGGGDEGGGSGSSSGSGTSSGSGSSGGSASSSGNGNGGTCPEGQISQGTLNGNAICVGQCPTGQYWGGVNGVYGCYGSGGSSAGSGSSDGTGECDPNSKDYAKCIGQLNDVDEGLSDQIIGDATGEAEDKMNEAYDSLTEDIENFSGIDNEFANSPNQLMSALQGFLPSPGACPNIPLTFMGQTASLDCNLFNDFKLAFGWFLSILTTVYIWSLATKPVER